MRYITSLAIGVTIAATTSGFAQNSAEGFYYSGVVQGEYYNSDSFSENAIYGDFIVGFNAADTGSLAWGAELSGEVLHVDGETLDVWNPILFFNTDSGKWSVGAPKSVTETYGIGKSFGRNGLLSLSQFGALSSSLPRVMAIVEEELVPGLLYDGKIGDTKVGFSYHRYTDGGSDLDMFAIAARHSLNDVDVFAGYEYATNGGNSEDRFLIGAEGTYGNFGYGAEYSNIAIIIGDYHTTRGYANYKITPQFTVGAEALYLDVPGDSVTFYGLNADYTFWKNAYVGVSYFDSSETPFESMTSARLGWKLDY